MYFTYLYEKRGMKPVEIVLSIGEGGKEELCRR
jgi:hypothetical protein